MNIHYHTNICLSVNTVAIGLHASFSFGHPVYIVSLLDINEATVASLRQENIGADIVGDRRISRDHQVRCLGQTMRLPTCLLHVASLDWGGGTVGLR